MINNGSVPAKNYFSIQKALAIVLLWGAALSLSGEDSSEIGRAVDGNTRFAFDMYALLAERNGNFIFSPFSMSSAFSLLWEGASGDTAEQLADTFHLDLSPESRRAASGAILDALDLIGDQEGIDFSLNNSLWLQEGFPVYDELIRISEEYYGTQLFRVDYINNSRKVFRMINRYARKKTGGHIPSVLKEPLSPDSRLVLLNIIFFKGDWKDKFMKSETRSRFFYLNDSYSREASMMYQKNYYDYYELDTAQVIDIPYAGNRISMMILLPGDIRDLPVLEENLTAGLLSRIQSEMKEELVELLLPKFDMTTEFDLMSPLMRLGTTDAFDPYLADFAIMENPPVNQYIDFARHGAAVKVNENGSEATAVTSAGGCFPGGTQVVTGEGLMPIESIVPGMRVLVYDFPSDNWTEADVMGSEKHDYSGDMVTIEAGKNQIEVTGNHPFYVLSGRELENRSKPEDLGFSEFLLSGTGRWVEARELQMGDVLMAQSGGELVIDALWATQKDQPVYNLSVDRHHNYAVTERAVLVHNKGSAEDRGIQFYADHPFVFLIWDRATGTILFMGRLMDPGE